MAIKLINKIFSIFAIVAIILSSVSSSTFAKGNQYEEDVALIPVVNIELESDNYNVNVGDTITLNWDIDPEIRAMNCFAIGYVLIIPLIPIDEWDGPMESFSGKKEITINLEGDNWFEIRCTMISNPSTIIASKAITVSSTQ